jgi:pSer/pThr/pTyr-binding forkhead associated (FHA) protein
MTGQGEADGPLWADGDMMFRVAGAGAEPDRLVKVRRPFAVIGRAGDADIVVGDRAVSSRHAYLHLDRRGVYAVDLVTRTGTRINGTPRMVGWLRPGDWLEVAGRRIELLRVRLGGAVLDPPPCNDDLLAEGVHDDLAGVFLEPHAPDDSPWELGSELVFLGWSASCGIQVRDSSVARTHCAIVRSAAGTYLVDLCGRQTWVEDRPVRGAAAVHDGDLITLGSTRFTARVEPPLRPAAQLPQVIPREEAASLLARVTPPADGPDFGDGIPNGQALATLSGAQPPLDLRQVPAEAQGALLAWMVGTIQGGHGEILRRQGEFQLAVTQALRQIQQDNAALLNAHLQRIEGIDRELAALRAELERRHVTPAPATPPPPPQAVPLRIPRQTAPEAAKPETAASTAWLLRRVNQLENENRSAWKDLLGRISPPKRPT